MFECNVDFHCYTRFDYSLRRTLRPPLSANLDYEISRVPPPPWRNPAALRLGPAFVDGPEDHPLDIFPELFQLGCICGRTFYGDNRSGDVSKIEKVKSFVIASQR